MRRVLMDGWRGPRTCPVETAACRECGQLFVCRWKESPREGWRGGRVLCNVCRPQREARLQAAAMRRLRARQRQPLDVACGHCGTRFEAKRKTARFCSAACRAAAHRARLN